MARHRADADRDADAGGGRGFSPLFRSDDGSAAALFCVANAEMALRHALPGESMRKIPGFYKKIGGDV